MIGVGVTRTGVTPCRWLRSIIASTNGSSGCDPTVRCGLEMKVDLLSDIPVTIRPSKLLWDAPSYWVEGLGAMDDPDCSPRRLGNQ